MRWFYPALVRNQGHDREGRVIVQQMLVTLVCDVCGVDESRKPVARRALTVDGKSVEVEVCDRDWPGAKLDAIFEVGRRPGRAPKVVD